MPKYIAKCVRSGAWWAISVPEIEGVFSQARRLNQVEAMAREAITLALSVNPQSVSIDVQPYLSDGDRPRASQTLTKHDS